ncbi:Secologanin synthase [Sesamum angolense]|uniref:Secologanin synthase n=1 Tax=Sesamum angolense TaxID=2727404 RepID=A0AAE1T9X7_9LAMI|nr:Secologanin synthase [Sesamum angolense]
MELLLSAVAVLSCTVVLTIYAWKILNWVWFVPRKLEKSLRQQGFVGNPYRFLLGDVKEMTRMAKQAYSKMKPIRSSIEISRKLLQKNKEAATDATATSNTPTPPSHHSPLPAVVSSPWQHAQALKDAPVALGPQSPE